MSRPSFVRKLTRAEQQHIRAALKDRDGRIVRRAQVVWFSSQGQKVQQIAGLLGLSEAAVARIIKAFSQRGVEALPDKPRSGRPCKATEGYVASLKEAVSKSPRDFEYVFSCWTLNRLREHIGRQHNVLMSPQQLSRILRKHGTCIAAPGTSWRIAASRRPF